MFRVNIGHRLINHNSHLNQKLLEKQKMSASREIISGVLEYKQRVEMVRRSSKVKGVKGVSSSCRWGTRQKGPLRTGRGT